MLPRQDRNEKSVFLLLLWLAIWEYANWLIAKSRPNRGIATVSFSQGPRRLRPQAGSVDLELVVFKRLKHSWNVTFQSKKTWGAKHRQSRLALRCYASYWTWTWAAYAFGWLQRGGKRNRVAQTDDPRLTFHSTETDEDLLTLCKGEGLKEAERYRGIACPRHHWRNEQNWINRERYTDRIEEVEHTEEGKDTLRRDHL